MKVQGFWIGVVLAVFAVGMACAQKIRNQETPASKPAWREQSLKVGQTERWFRVYAPENLPENAPVVVLLHGGTQSMRKIFGPEAGGTREWLALAEAEKFLLLVPNGTNPRNNDTKGDRQNWNDLRTVRSNADSQEDDVRFIRELLEWTGKNYSVDRSRVYVTGASNGGMMTFRLLIEAPELFAAGAAFIANLPEERSVLKQPSVPTPLMIMNGTKDPLVQWEGGDVAGGRGRTLSSAGTVSWWLQANRAESTSPVKETLPDRDPSDGCRIYKTVYAPKPNGATVAFYRVEGGGHAMPSQNHALPDNRLIRRMIGPVCKDAEGAKLAWEFFQGKSRKPAPTTPPTAK
ncbi:MAG: PHB depolymerase family esterase [Armatimonadaceae bacterium]